MTCRDLITEALGEIRAYAAGETPSVEDMNMGLVRLQRISDTFLKDASPTLTLDSTVPGPDDEALMYELAFRLCGPFGGKFTAEQMINRRRAKSRLLAALDTPADALAEDGILYLDGNVLFSGDFSTGRF